MFDGLVDAVHLGDFSKALTGTSAEAKGLAQTEKITQQAIKDDKIKIFPGDDHKPVSLEKTDRTRIDLRSPFA
ncbi:hypothetical protein PCANC_20080 [Puccinia coronata f. sp. avenae]|uniref:Uncharacterized protein n=1 Tax=Puccinia coronata f. sp. avenae TaxID=200324 RepID=A0A2N5U8S7_9BASI|nr:hypothetical protein PCANC_20081 [Puccinia coronata f. sp. avenae]PLW34151.1 hypothetical protein PCANC_20080 [Puccinia coronata f. sp. avenae]